MSPAGPIFEDEKHVIRWAKQYVDGEILDSAVGNGVDAKTDSRGMFLGHDHNFSNRVLDGYIDEVAYFHDALIDQGELREWGQIGRARNRN